jgi:hypothetical protein
MIFSPFLLSPYPWLVVAAFFTGEALNRLLRSAKRAKDPQRAKAHKKSLAILFFILAFMAMLGALFVPGLDKFVNNPLGLLTFYLIISLVFFLALRFKRLFGLPFAIIFVMLIAAIFLFLQAVTAFTGETEIARVKVESIKDDIIRYDFMPVGEEPEVVVAKGVNFAPEVKLIIFDDFLVFFGAKTWYRFDALLHYDPSKSTATQTVFNRYPLKRVQGISEALYNFVIQNQDVIPGIKTVQGQITYAVPIAAGQTYVITVQNDGGVEVRRVK